MQLLWIALLIEALKVVHASTEADVRQLGQRTPSGLTASKCASRFRPRSQEQRSDHGLASFQRRVVNPCWKPLAGKRKA